MRKRSVTLAGHRTSISLEDEFWAALNDEAARRGMTATALIAEIDRARGARNLSSVIRVHILNKLRAQSR